MSSPTSITAVAFAMLVAAVTSAQTPETAAPPHIQNTQSEVVEDRDCSGLGRAGLQRDPGAFALSGAKPTSNPEGHRYLYEAKVKNIGDRIIRAMRWDYVFIDPSTQEEVDRRRFYSTVTIHPNHEKTLEGYTRSAPMSMVSAQISTPALRNERVVIECITLSDGSTWRLPSFKGSCSPVKSSRP